MYKIFSFKRITDAAAHMDAEAFNYIYECQTEGFESFDDFDLLAFDFYDIKNESNDTKKLMIYFDKKSLFFFCEDSYLEDRVKSIADKISAAQNASAEHILYLFFARLLKGDVNYLQNFEQTLSEEEDSILADISDAAPKRIIARRKELLRIKRYYAQLSAIFDELSENDNKLISASYRRRFSALKSRADRYLSEVLGLQEAISQMRETYQSQLAIRQNDLMQIFTVVTVIFLPLTLIAGWYGMNFTNMPEIKWRYGYICVIVISVALISFMVWYFKKKKWL